MIETLPEPTPLLFYGFMGLSLVMACLFVAGLAATRGARTAWVGGVLSAAWMIGTAVLASTGFLDAWAPPRLGLVLIGMTAILVWAMRGEWALSLASLPVGLLVGIQGFRVVVELLIHEAVAQGVANPTLTWTGTNFDIVPGVTAVLLAPIAHRVGTRWLAAWNIASAAVLGVTVITALMAAPTPLRIIGGEPPNVWVAAFPFVWLPAVLVLFAWAGHVVLFRHLAQRSGEGRS